MIVPLLTPLVSERFLTDARYRDGHLRVVNALPSRRVLGLHAPEMKLVARLLSRSGGAVELPNGERKECQGGAAVIRCFEAVPSDSLCYEETVVWGYLINLEKCSLADRLKSVLSIGVDVRLMEPNSIERSQGKGKHVIDNRKLK